MAEDTKIVKKVDGLVIEISLFQSLSPLTHTIDSVE